MIYLDDCKQLLSRVAKTYKESREKGKFYDTKTVEDCGRTYTNIYAIHGVLKESSFETVGDWMEQLTGNMGLGFSPETYQEVIWEMIEDFVYDELEKMEVEEEEPIDDEIKLENCRSIEDEIMGLTIDELKQYY